MNLQLVLHGKHLPIKQGWSQKLQPVYTINEMRFLTRVKTIVCLFFNGQEPLIENIINYLNFLWTKLITTR